MRARGPRRPWVAGGISVLVLLVGCTDSTPTGGSAGSTESSNTASQSPLACDTFEVRSADSAPGDWVLSEYVLVRAPEGTNLTATLPTDAPIGIALGESPESGPSETRTEGLTVRRANVATVPASDLDPATLLAAIGQADGDPLLLTSTGQDGFTGELTGELSEDDALVYRGARETAVTFTGDCSNGAEARVPVTGSASYFTLAESGLLDCGTPADPGTLAAVAAEFCTTD